MEKTPEVSEVTENVSSAQMLSDEFIEESPLSVPTPVVNHHPSLIKKSDKNEIVEEKDKDDDYTNDELSVRVDSLPDAIVQHKINQHSACYVKEGLFTGCFATLLIVYAILASMIGMFTQQAEAAYMDTVYPVFSFFALLTLHLFLYGCNLLMWKSTKIDYNVIFQFRPSNALTFRDACFISTSIMTMLLSSMIIHLIILSKSAFPNPVINAIPGIQFLIFIGLLICPFNILYRPTRYYFLRVLWRIICSPFYKVLFVDVFMADQLTSQIPLMRHLETSACYFIANTFAHQTQTCKTGRLSSDLVYMLSFAPYYWRAMQCGRRYFNERNVDQLANLGKYVSAMIAAGARVIYSRDTTSMLWPIIVIGTSLLATLYQLYWDFVKDWGFFVPKSKNCLLRDNLILKKKGIYYVSLVINLVLRVAWMETVLKFPIEIPRTRLLDFILASLEVIRRGHWNFYRLENEHLHIVYRK